MENDSVIRWQVGASTFELTENAAELNVSCVVGGTPETLATLTRGTMGAVIEMHSPRGCELRILVDESDPVSLYCPHNVCVVLLVKLRKFQGGKLEIIQPDSEQLVD